MIRAPCLGLRHYGAGTCYRLKKVGRFEKMGVVGYPRTRVQRTSRNSLVIQRA
jgi:hypothetical protein